MGSRVGKKIMGIAILMVAFAIFLFGSVYAENIGCCIVTQNGDKCMNNFPESACVSGFFKAGMDCSQEPNCVQGCCKSTCTETFQYDCEAGFDSTVESCDQLEACQPGCLYFSDDYDCMGRVVPCWGNENFCKNNPSFSNLWSCGINKTISPTDCLVSKPSGLQRGDIYGTIRDSGNKVIANAYVYLSSGAFNYSDQNGKYLLPKIPKGVFTLSVKKAGYYDNETTVTSSSSGVSKNFTLRLKPFMTLDGRVFKNGILQEGVSLNLQGVAGNTNQYFIITDKNGYFNKEDIKPGTYQVTIYKDGESSGANPDQVTIPNEQGKVITQDFSYGGQSGVGSGKYHITGYVKNESNGGLVSGIALQLFDRNGNPIAGATATSGVPRAGFFNISNVPSGNYYVYAAGEGYLPSTTSSFFIYSSNVKVNITIKKNAEEVVDQEDKANLTIYVYACEDSTKCSTESDLTPLKDADVMLFLVKNGAKYGYNTPKKTNSSGAVTFVGIKKNDKDESFSVEASKQYYGGSNNKRTSIVFGSGNTLVIGKSDAFAQRIYLIKQRVYTIRQNVQDCTGSLPVPLGQIRVFISSLGLNSQLTPDSTGQYVISNVPEGTFTIEAMDTKTDRTTRYMKYSKTITVNRTKCPNGGICDSIDFRICLPQLSCSPGIISSDPSFSPKLFSGSEMKHYNNINAKRGVQDILLGLRMQASSMIRNATNPGGCTLKNTTIYYCTDCKYDPSDGETGATPINITDGWNAIGLDNNDELRKTDFLISNSFNITKEISRQKLGARTIFKNVTLEPEKKYCFFVMHEFESDAASGKKIVQRMSEIRCTYSGIVPCLKGRPAFCFKTDATPGESYTFSMKDSFYSGSCAENKSAISFSRCPSNQKCYVKPDNTVGCAFDNYCLNCSGSFGVFTFLPTFFKDGSLYDCTADPYNKVCFLDRNYNRDSRFDNSPVFVNNNSNDFISTVDVYKSCNMVDSCYDYKSASACNNNICLKFRGINCSWNSDSRFGFLGDGVCSPLKEEDQDCSRCHDPTNRFFGLCDAPKCALFGKDSTGSSSCYFRYSPTTKTDDSGNFVGLDKENPVNYRCVNRRDVACEDYNNKDDCLGANGIGRQIYPLKITAAGYSSFLAGFFSTKDNRNAQRFNSSDVFARKTCRWIPKGISGSVAYASNENFDGSCVKDSDYSTVTVEKTNANFIYYNGEKSDGTGIDCGITDSENSAWRDIRGWTTGDAKSVRAHLCSLDNAAPDTKLQKTSAAFKGSPLLRIPFEIKDLNQDGIKLEALLLNSTPIRDSFGRMLPDGFGVRAKATKISLAGNKKVMDFGGVSTGNYSVLYFSRDMSNNLEVVKIDGIKVISSAPGVFIDWGVSPVAQDMGNSLISYKNDLTINVSSAGPRLECHSKLFKTGMESEEIGSDFNPIPFDDGATGTSWSIKYPELETGSYVFKIYCKDEMNFSTRNFMINRVKEIGEGNLTKPKMILTLKLNVNSDQNMRFEPKIATIRQVEGTSPNVNFYVYTAVDAVCKIKKGSYVAVNGEENITAEIRDVKPVTSGGFLDTSKFDTWMPSDFKDMFSKTILEYGMELNMNYRHKFTVPTNDVSKDEPTYYYIWCKYILPPTNREVYGEISEVNRFALIKDVVKPTVIFFDESEKDNLKKTFSIDKWMSPLRFDKVNIECLDFEQGGYEFGRLHTRENMTICVNANCTSGSNVYKLSNYYQETSPFDLSYSCTDYYDTEIKSGMNTIDTVTKKIKLDNVQPTVSSYAVAYGSKSTVNSCGNSIIKDDPLHGFLGITVGVNNYAIDSKSALSPKYIFGDFEIRAKITDKKLNATNSMTFNFREGQSNRKYSIVISDKDGGFVTFSKDGMAIAQNFSTSKSGKVYFNLSSGTSKPNYVVISVKGNSIKAYVDGVLMINKTNDAYQNGGISVLEEGISASSFGVVAEDMGAPLDPSRSTYKIGSFGTVMRDRIVPYSNDNGKVFANLFTNEIIAKNALVDIYFMILDEASLVERTVYSDNVLRLAVDSAAPTATVDKVPYTTDDLSGFSQAPKFDYKDNVITLEYGLTTFLDIFLGDPFGCSGAGIDQGLIGVGYSVNNGAFQKIAPIYDTATGKLKVNLTAPGLMYGYDGMQLRLNISDNVGNNKVYYYTMKVVDTMGPRLKMNLTLKYNINQQLAPGQTTRLLGPGEYAFCLEPNLKDDKYLIDRIEPSIPYVFVKNFDYPAVFTSGSYCGVMSIIPGTKYSSQQAPREIRVVAHDINNQVAVSRFLFNIDTTMPPQASIVPPFREYVSGLIDGKYTFKEYPLDFIEEGETLNDYSYVYTNITELVVTGFAPSGVTSIIYNDSRGEHPITKGVDFLEENNKTDLGSVVLRVNRVAKNGTSYVIINGTNTDKILQGLLSDPKGAYVVFSHGSERIFQRSYPNYGKYYRITASSDKLFGKRLSGEVVMNITPPLEVTLDKNFTADLYLYDSIPRLFRLNVQLRNNSITDFSIKTENNIGTQTYVLPSYKIVTDTVAPKIDQHSMYPPKGTFNKNYVNLTFNVYDEVAGISAKTVHLFMNGAEVDNTRISVSGEGPVYTVSYDPELPIEDGPYNVSMIVYDRAMNRDTYWYSFKMSSGAPDYPIVTLSTEIFNYYKEDQSIWFKDRKFHAKVFFDDDLNVTVTSIDETGMMNSFSQITPFVKTGRNTYEFDGTINGDLKDGLAYTFEYTVSAFRTFADGNVSPTGQYEINTIYDTEVPRISLPDAGKVRRFLPRDTYTIPVVVMSDEYTLMNLTIFAGYNFSVSEKVFQVREGSSAPLHLDSMDMEVSVEEISGSDILRTAKVKVDGITLEVEEGRWYMFAEKNLTVVNITSGKEASVVFRAYDHEPRNVGVERVLLRKIYQLDAGKTLYEANFKIPRYLENNTVIPLTYNISDFAKNSVLAEQNIIVDTQAPVFDIINVTVTNPDMYNSSEILTLSLYKEMRYWTNRSMIRIIAQMRTPDIQYISATNHELSQEYLGSINMTTQRFVVDIELKGTKQEEQLNKISVFAQDEVGNYYDSGLTVNRDLLAPELKKVHIQDR